MKFNLQRTLTQIHLCACGLDVAPLVEDLAKAINRQNKPFMLASLGYGRLTVRCENKKQELNIVFDVPADSDLQKVCQWFMEEIK